ncbi:hypothetical protein CEUSTIGMA_g5588.t1 [Chlamydomonas eustigma]|uniref:Golgi apparatus protein 1 n=1 Tax=Chlamydomonas eustigma TaxID=1157962 RepID=A0A250X526_9CHLO|nr:hypothetical protein CEUSTIGMA_g5588.t1 [Chlamydomonas eustigma]|eukprot:GAX78146.1 hypothetical protein CEUSTIGMA_g5588.t1 [Chlamydomonas eustigma]
MQRVVSAFFFVFILLCVGPSLQDDSADSKNDRKTSAGKKSKVVSVAPEADLVNGIDDVDPKGNCVVELKKYCSTVEEGEGKLAECLSDLITESETTTDDEAPTISDACREETYQFKINRNSNINANIPLAKACKVDAEKSCNVTWFFGYKSGQVIACLRDIKSSLAPSCQKELFKVQKDAAEDFRSDVQLGEACKDDAANLCKDVKKGGGRVQACLRDHRLQLTWLCEEQLFRQEAEDADDVRLSVRLFNKCLPDKKKFCGQSLPGNSQVKDCLEKNRNQKGFSSECKEEIDQLIERRVRDFKLDFRLRNSCEKDIYETCAFYGDDLGMDGDSSNVIHCLQDYFSELKVEKCKEQVKKYQELAAEDIRFDSSLADACYADRQKFCASIPPGSARVIRCLMDQRVKLDQMCQAVLFDEEVKFSQNIDFQYPMRQSCEQEIKVYCKDVPPGEARVIRCLQEHKYEKDFSKDCKEKVRSYEAEAASDYRLNYRLAKACKNDVKSLCSAACSAEEGQVCSGTVLRCLTEKREDIKSDDCKKEVFYFEKMEVTDYRNDVILAAACREDVEKFCKDTEPGEGRVHACLRINRKQISEGCRKEELLLEEQEAENVELKVGVMKICRDERQLYCKGVAPGQARMFRCLAENMGDHDFGETCREEIMDKLQRRQANWKLDPPLRKACKPSVQELCSKEDQANSEEGAVYKCLIRQYMDLGDGCQKELGRAVHMAFFAWRPGGIITSDCDKDIEANCASKRPNMAKTPGAVGSCLATILEEMVDSPAGASKSRDEKTKRGLSESCRVLADVAEPPNVKAAFDASLTVVLMQSQLEALESKTGVQMLVRDRAGNAQGVTLTGWTALAGIAALIVLVMFSASYAWGKYRGANKDGYTLVVKKSGGR